MSETSEIVLDENRAEIGREVAMLASLLRAIERDPNPNGRWKGAVVSESGTALLIDVAEGDGVRTFVLDVREV